MVDAAGEMGREGAFEGERGEGREGACSCDERSLSTFDPVLCGRRLTQPVGAKGS